MINEFLRKSPFFLVKATIGSLRIRFFENKILIEIDKVALDFEPNLDLASQSAFHPFDNFSPKKADKKKKSAGGNI